ncbi:hypothetical protein GLOTRDRAFT_126155 [Gloeophyllum trabeum ATCC 11539]|uniref:Uncharacterized protein n=1 Tax=Gloeophyllum trabeum (strain ATCC 11539 / FP-39264 / Madison 617) TaxID=670483 RepID=S7RY30_GLOTA|nr:uncharacterized protein GLOTRDRAFT_126155 [Gloeophyllum trabeum ATCC 11539]EPQ59860.1 hypothetical protein GLOTRDRAFT_126155 [Gloeophyllum trabeum ATCC 11539]
MHSWRDIGNVILHPVDSAAQWPPEATSVSNALKAPLPDWVFYGPHPFMSKHCRPLAAELKAQRPLVRTGRSASCSLEDSSSNVLRLSFDLALCATALLRSSIQVEPEMPQDAISKTPIIAHFLRNLISIYAPDALSFYEAEYVLPRHPMYQSNPLRKFMPKTAIASLIVCSAAIEMPDDRSVCSTSTDSQDGTGPSLDDLSDHASSPLSASSGRLRRKNEAADWLARHLHDEDSEESDESEDDTTTVACDPALNRHLLACASPRDTVHVPFLCLCEGDGIFGVLASALYQRLACGIKTPIVGLTYHYGSPVLRVLVAWIGECDAPDGSLPPVHIAYEDNSGHPLSFGVFDLHHPVGSLRLASPPTVPFSWRSDLDPMEENNSDSDDSTCSIATWVQNMADATRDSDDPQSVALVKAMAPRQVQTRASGSTWSGGSSGGPRSAVLSGFQGENSNYAVRKYEEYATFQWPTEWETFEKMPAVDPLVEDLKRDLFMVFQARQRDAKAPAASPSSGSVYEMISAKLSFILHVCRSVRQSRLAPSDAPNSYEFETRLEWDILVREIMRSDDVCPLPERTLRLPKNINMENDFSEAYRGAVGTALLAQANLFSSASGARVGREKTHFRSYAGRMAEAASSLLNEGYDVPGEEDAARSQEEPKSGRCDNICSFKFRGFYPPGRDDIYKFHRLIIQNDSKMSPPDPSEGQQPEPLKASKTRVRPEENLRPDSIFGSSRNESQYTKANSEQASAVPTTPTDETRPKTAGAETPGTSDVEASDSLYAPLLMVEYKKKHDANHVATATNQCRMYTVAASKFLAHLGICEFPTFGLIGTGSIGAVTCTYTMPAPAQVRSNTSGATIEQTDDLEITYVVEAGARLFDLSTPIGVFHFSTFLCMLLHDHAKDMKAKLAEARPDFHTMCRDEGQKVVWTRDMQPDVLQAVSDAVGKTDPPSDTSSAVQES